MTQPPKPPDKFAVLQRQSKALYGPSAGGDRGAGSIELSISNYEKRKVAALRDDPEKLGQFREEMRKFRAVAERKNMRPDDVHTVLSTLHDYEATPRAKGTIDGQWPKTFEALRIEHGSTENAQRVVSRAARVAQEFMREVPSLAGRAGETGAVNDARVVNILARYGDDSPPPAAA